MADSIPRSNNSKGRLVTSAPGAGEFRNRYLAMLSHDLRSALSGVIGGLSGIEAQGLDQKSAEHREAALAAAIDASRLLDGILDMEAIEKGELKLDEITTDIDEFLMSLHRRWSIRAGAKGCKFSVSKGIPIPDQVEIDANRLARALGNIIDNAIKYSENGTVSLTANLDQENTLLFRIRDQGPGFSDGALDKLFEFRGRPEGNAKPGSGLGLHIAKTLVSQMGGDISVRNTGKGAEVKVLIPLDADTDVSDNNGASLAILPNTSLPDLSHLNILMAEDNLTNQVVVSQMLEAMGARFKIASDGIEAVNLFQNHEFNVALLDIEMPRMSGLDVIRTIRSSTGKKADIPIVALTAYAMREHRERISAAGADGLIAKPILGIEDFGIELLRYTKRLNARAETQRPQKSSENRDESDLIDKAIYDSLANTLGPATMQDLLHKVTEDLQRIRTELSRALDADDVAAYRASSHVLISVAGAIGALSTQQLAEQLNSAAHSGQLSNIRLVAKRCLTNIDLILKFAHGNLNRN